MKNGVTWRVLLVVFNIMKFTLGNTHAGADHPTVHTSLGVIKGIEKTVDGIKVKAFLGVPYGKSPVGDRRFGIPEMVDKWTGEFDAKHPARACFSAKDETFSDFSGSEMWNPTNTISEDCLAMNIWVPEKHDGSIMVWIFGGGFFSGSPSLDLYDGRVLAAKHNTIVININYRLGPFGFLYFGEDSASPGNMGFLDQQLALKWINTNIGSFGGNASRLTLFGESAGSASVTSHLLAPDSYKYFHRIICNSGSIVHPWATRAPETILEHSKHLARRVNCTSDDLTAIRNCMKNVPASVIQAEADKETASIGVPLRFAFGPVAADKNFFKGNFLDRIRRRDFKKDVAAIVGTVEDEGTYWLPYTLEDSGFFYNHTISAESTQNQAHITHEQYKKSMGAFMPYFAQSPIIQHGLFDAYHHLNNKQIHERLRDGVGRFLGDYFFTCDINNFADILSDHINGPLHMYYFTWRSSANPWPKWMGSMHGYEIEYEFGRPYRRPEIYDEEELEDEQKFSSYIMKTWTDFAHKGIIPDYWPEYDNIERKALHLGKETIRGLHKIVEDVHGSSCRLIEEGRAIVDRATECRASLSDLPAKTKSSSSLSLTASSSLILTYTLFILLFRTII